MKTIELIVPCYNEESCISLFYDRIKEVFLNMPGCEFIITFVDDGSKDNTIQEIKKVVERVDTGKVQYISLSRNFGKESAMYAGLSKSVGDYVAVMDADLQHPPELLKKMLDAIENEGYDCASARRVSRKGDPLIKSVLSRAFYHVINHVTVIDLVPGSTDYRLMKRKVVKAIVAMSERERFTKGIYAWVGFKNKWIEYENVERIAGETKWSFWKLFLYSLDGIMAFSTVPLSIASIFGILFCVLAFVFVIFIFVRALLYGDPVAGWPSMVCIILFIGGVQLLCVGIMGQYMSKMYMEVKDRPKYLVKEEF